KTAFRVTDETLSELDRLDWLSEASLESAKRGMLLQEVRSRVYAEDLADDLGRERWWRGDAKLAFTRMREVDAVTVREVAAAWRRYVRDAKKIRIYVKPERVPFYIRMFGWLYPLFS